MKFVVVFLIFHLARILNSQKTDLTGYIRNANRETNTQISLLAGTVIYKLDLAECLFTCARDPACVAVELNTLLKQCRFYGIMVSGYMTSSTKCHIYQKKDSPLYSTNGLVHYWPIVADMIDYVTLNLFSKDNSASGYGTNRYGHTGSALNTNGGHFKADNDYYFYGGDFSITVWILPRNMTNNAVVLDCGKGAGSDNIILGYSYGVTGKPYVGVYNNADGRRDMISSVPVNTNVWNHLVVTLQTSTVSLFINGSWIQDWTVSYTPRKVKRNKCYLGTSDFASIDPAFVLIDQIKFYDRSLTRAEVANDYRALWV